VWFVSPLLLAHCVYVNSYTASLFAACCDNELTSIKNRLIKLHNANQQTKNTSQQQHTSHQHCQYPPEKCLIKLNLWNMKQAQTVVTTAPFTYQQTKQMYISYATLLHNHTYHCQKDATSMKKLEHFWAKRPPGNSAKNQPKLQNHGHGVRTRTPIVCLFHHHITAIAKRYSKWTHKLSTQNLKTLKLQSNYLQLYITDNL